MEVKLPDIGEGMTEGEVLQYFVKVGDTVQPDQPLLEIQTDKMTAEIPAPARGVITEIVIAPEQTVEVGTTLLKLESLSQTTELHEQSKKMKTEALPQKLKASKPVVEKTTKTSVAWKRVLAAPYTRKIAREHEVEIDEISGSGPGGRVTEEDVYRFIKRQQDEQKHHRNQIENHAQQVDESYEEVIPFKGRRKQIAKKMSKSIYTIPHVTHFDEIDVTEAIVLKEAWKRNGQKISVASVFIKATVLALKEFPIFNAELDDENEQIRLKKQYHLGIAVDTEDGLIVPVIKHADKKSLREIDRELKELTKKAQQNQLAASEMRGSTFTISNVGPLGSTGATPIIHYPEAALLAFHKTKRMPVVREGDEIVIRSMMNISLSFDHRVADGAAAVAFTNRLTQFIENPNLLLLELV